MLLADVVEPRSLVGYVRGLAFEATQNPFGLSQFLPDKKVETTEFRFDRGMLRDEDSATFRGWDTESPIARREGLTRVTGSIPPISRKIPVGEETALRLRAIDSGDLAPLARKIYDDAAKLTRSIIVRRERAMGEALETGKIILNENNVKGTVDFGRDASMAVTASPLWTSLTTADFVSDELTWLETYYNLNGTLPAVQIMSLSMVNKILRHDKIKTQVGALTGTPAVVPRAALDSVLSAFDLPPILVYKGKARINATTQVDVLDPKKVLFLPPASEPLGNTFIGVTAEAVELVGRGFLTSSEAMGIISVSYAEPDPVATWTKCGAVMLPIVANPNLTMSATVSA